MTALAASEIGARIAQARRQAGFTQEELAELGSFSKRSLQDYENGTTIPYKQMRELGELLGASVEWLLYGDGDGGVVEVLARLEELMLAMRADLTSRLTALQADVAEIRRRSSGGL